ncbi:MAG: cytidine deaminase [bacterium]|nr:cytidine deaminase [bacterium]
MRIVKRESEVIEYELASELSDVDQALLAEARQAMEKAYAPYSRFLVGCALMLENGVLVKGSNQENMAYPSGLCAERVAIFYAGANYPGVRILNMAITAKAKDYDLNIPIMSCGACLQSLSEYEMQQKSPIRTLLQVEDGPVWLAENGTKTFLPFQFYVAELKR